MGKLMENKWNDYLITGIILLIRDHMIFFILLIFSILLQI